MRVMEAPKPPPFPEQLGRNTAQVRWAFDALGKLAPKSWRALEEAFDGSPARDAAEEALSVVLTKEDLRESWFELRKAVAALAKQPAADYAQESGEGVRTLVHPVTTNTWEGEREKTIVETLEPAHEDGFTNAACEMLGILMLRPYVSAADFKRFWQPYAKVITLPD